MVPFKKIVLLFIKELHPSGTLNLGFHMGLIWDSFFPSLRVSDGPHLDVIWILSGSYLGLIIFFPVSVDENEDEKRKWGTRGMEVLERFHADRLKIVTETYMTRMTLSQGEREVRT